VDSTLHESFAEGLYAHSEYRKLVHDLWWLKASLEGSQTWRSPQVRAPYPCDAARGGFRPPFYVSCICARCAVAWLLLLLCVCARKRVAGARLERGERKGLPEGLRS
jgi:hypothetical protein